VSHDQRPGRIRVIDASAQDARRRGDAGGNIKIVPKPGAARAGAGEGEAAAAAATGARGAGLLPGLLFLAACAAGGAGVTALILLG
jgi:hypothetical protein